MGNDRMPTRGNPLKIPAYTEILSSTLPDGAATSDNQTDGTQVTKLKETVPTDALNNNGSGVLAYDGNGDLSTITKTIGAVSYIKTLTYTTRVLTGISIWSIV